MRLRGLGFGEALLSWRVSEVNVVLLAVRVLREKLVVVVELLQVLLVKLSRAVLG